MSVWEEGSNPATWQTYLTRPESLCSSKSPRYENTPELLSRMASQRERMLLQMFASPQRNGRFRLDFVEFVCSTRPTHLSQPPLHLSSGRVTRRRVPFESSKNANLAMLGARSTPSLRKVEPQKPRQSNRGEIDPPTAIETRKPPSYGNS